MNENIIGRRLKALREEKGLSPAQLSDELAPLGVTLSPEEISAIESLCRPICDIELLALARALDCGVNALFS